MASKKLSKEIITIDDVFGVFKVKRIIGKKEMKRIIREAIVRKFTGKN